MEYGLPNYEVDEIGEISQLSDHIGWGIRDLQIPSQWSQTKGENVTVMVIDSGLANHPDIGDNEIKDLSKSFIKEKKQDIQGHGTHVGGIIVAQNNAFGVVGVAPKAKIISVKALNRYGKTNDVILKECLEYVLEVKPDIVNISLGSYHRQQGLEKLYKEIIYENNIPIVCAAGNKRNKGVMYPAKYPYTISVGSYNENQKLSDFSAISKDGKYIDFVAPGDKILSTYLKEKYAIMSGTSMAAPFLAGILALLISEYKRQDRKYSVEELRNVLAATSIDMGLKGKDNKFGHGIINVERALREIDGHNLGILTNPKKPGWIKTLLNNILWWRK